MTTTTILGEGATAGTEVMVVADVLNKVFRFGEDVWIMSHPVTPAAIIVLYLFLVYWVTPGLVKRYEPIERIGKVKFHTFGMMYNAMLSFLSLLLLVVMLKTLIEMERATSLFDVVCDPNAVFVGTPIYILYFVNYLLKYVELIDTLLIQMRGKSPMKLQVYHHFITLALTYIQGITESSIQWLPIVLNLAVHVCMYAHFAWMEHETLARLRDPTKHVLSSDKKHPWWRTALTMFQIFQFVVAMILGIIVLGMRLMLRLEIAPPNMPVCHGTDGGAVFGFGVLGSFLVAFVNFFITDRRNEQKKRLERKVQQQSGFCSLAQQALHAADSTATQVVHPPGLFAGFQPLLPTNQDKTD